MTMRKPEKLRAQSVHVLWSLRQLLELAEHLQARHEEGVSVMVEPLDAAALEAFCVHARALIEFLWRDRKHRDDERPKPRRENAVAADWFASGEWAYEPELPDELRDVSARTGWGVAHISYDRLNGERPAGWDHVGIAHRIAHRFASFATDVDPAVVAAGFIDESYRMIIQWRGGQPFALLDPPPSLSASPAHPGLWSAALE
jgi:hypothetical protein